MNVVAKDMFSRFKDGKGHLKACLQHQTKGMLSLYEASYLEKEGELVLSQAMDFTTKHLKKLMEQGSLEPPLREQVASALELPLHWRMHRLHARWDINAIDKFPEYMKMCFLAVFNLANNAAYRIMKEKNAELQRGDVAKALQCCMHERDVSESAAREHVGDLIRANWRALNGNHPSNCFTTVASNTPRVSQFMYGNGDGYGIPDGETKNQVMAFAIRSVHEAAAVSSPNHAIDIDHSFPGAPFIVHRRAHRETIDGDWGRFQLTPCTKLIATQHR
ncbi:hypothetical protein GW17_00051913 [Ensete ventricosum]|nr:hypothetical protein GW17_00051913 [Ensete ventricosum]